MDDDWWNLGEIENYVPFDDEHQEGTTAGAAFDEMMGTELTREILMEGIHQLFVDQVLTASGDVRCLFKGQGCRMQFENSTAMKAHLPDCFSGVFRYCKDDVCSAKNEGIAENLSDVIMHAITRHGLGNTLAQYESEPIEVCLTEKDLFPNPKGYSIKLLESQRVFINPRENFRMLFSLVVQDVGGPDKRVMFVPMLYTDPTFLVEVECTLRGRDGVVVQPIAYPGFELQEPSPPSVRSYAFKSINDFIDASSYLDGVVSYSLNDILSKAADENGAYPKKLTLEIKIRGFRCIISKNSLFSPLEPALTWEETRISDDVRRTLDDGEHELLSFESSIILPQLRGQSDLIVECVKIRKAANVVMGGVLDYVRRLDQGVDDERATTPVKAIVFYPSVMMVREYEKIWKRCARAIKNNVFALDSNLTNLWNQLLHHGGDVLLTTPSLWSEFFRTCNDDLIELLVSRVKFVVFHNLHKFCVPETLRDLEMNVATITMEASKTIRIGLLERIEPAIIQKISNSENENSLFPVGWNQFRIGQDPEHFISDMNIRWQPNDNDYSKITLVMEFMERFPPMRWLILTRREGWNMRGWSVLTEEMERIISKRDLTIVWNESDVFSNGNFWEPFVLRQTGVMIGPYFLLDCPSECMECDGVIIFDPPEHRADLVRIGNILEGKNGGRKPCIGFK